MKWLNPLDDKLLTVEIDERTQIFNRWTSTRVIYRDIKRKLTAVIV
jgi:hypothetical protein